MPKDIAIFGFGGLGRELQQLIEEINESNKVWNFIGFFDDREINHERYQGGVNELLRASQNLNVAIAIADGSSVKNVFENVAHSGISFPNIIHPSAHCKAVDCVMGYGNIVFASCHFTVGIVIGNFNIFNVRVTIGHDAVIGSYNTLLTNCTISGNVKIGNLNYFGMNSSIIQGRSIGNNCMIGASSLVMQNVKSGERVFGNPAFKL